MSRPLLVGEANPYGEDPDYALWPYPERASGGRLCRLVLGLTADEYLARFDRVNLCDTAWSAPAARYAATAIRAASTAGSATVLLGRKVATAFGWSDWPFFRVQRGSTGSWVLLPHPSGLCRTWNEPGAFERARAALQMAGVLA